MIANGFEEDVWVSGLIKNQNLLTWFILSSKFHVDNVRFYFFSIYQYSYVLQLSSAHVYMRLHEGMSWDNIPQNALIDCAQLVKANSIQGNKRDNVTVCM